MTKYERKRVFNPKTMSYGVDLVAVPGGVESDVPPEGDTPNDHGATPDEEVAAQEAVAALLEDDKPKPEKAKKTRRAKRKAKKKKTAE